MAGDSTPLDTSCQAEYADGYVHDETERDDVSSFEPGKNVFYDILHRLLEPEHGPMVRFSAFWKDERYDVDFSTLPANARPIRFRHGYCTFNHADGEVLDSGWSGIDFGHQFTDDAGRNQQEVLELR